ncbi:DUF86 domain-containing protein [Candidatus Gottesmanbacteria bacterium]|nr:DUF86 domain-containing protein [Candidatus Gottesmanbacteria bacterium]
MPINKDLLAKKLDFLNQHLSAIERMEFNEQKFVEDENIHDLIVFRLQQAVETAIDIGAHIIAEADFPRKETAKDIFLFLGEQKIIDKELSLHIGKAADFRNRVVHGYNNFDYSLLFQDYKENLRDLRNFGNQVLNFIDSGSI